MGGGYKKGGRRKRGVEIMKDSKSEIDRQGGGERETDRHIEK